jgi:hypothetical protein
MSADLVLSILSTSLIVGGLLCHKSKPVATIRENFLGNLNIAKVHVPPPPKDVKCGTKIIYSVPTPNTIAVPKHSEAQQQKPCAANFKDMVYDTYSGGPVNTIIIEPDTSCMKTDVSELDGISLPIGTMSTIDNTSTEDNGEIVYDRYVFANRTSRLRQYGDPIRGDIPIEPSKLNYFRPSANPQFDLQEGALNVIAGCDDLKAERERVIRESACSRNYMTFTETGC